MSECVNHLRIYVGPKYAGKYLTIKATSQPRGRVRTQGVLVDSLGYVELSHTNVLFAGAYPGKSYTLEFYNTHHRVCLPVCCGPTYAGVWFELSAGGLSTVILNPPCEPDPVYYCGGEMTPQLYYCGGEMTPELPCGWGYYCASEMAMTATYCGSEMQPTSFYCGSEAVIN